MKIGQEVNLYIPQTDQRFAATIVKIVGVGPSRKKLLNLRPAKDEEILEKVPHFDDAAKGEPFWLLRGKERAPEGWSDIEAIEEEAEA